MYSSNKKECLIVLYRGKVNVFFNIYFIDGDRHIERLVFYFQRNESPTNYNGSSEMLKVLNVNETSLPFPHYFLFFVKMSDQGRITQIASSRPRAAAEHLNYHVSIPSFLVYVVCHQLSPVSPAHSHKLVRRDGNAPYEMLTRNWQKLINI